MQVQEKMAHFVMGGQSRVDIFQDLKYVALIHPCCSCMFLDVFSFVTSAGCLPLISVLVVGVQTMYQAECGTPSLYLFLCVFLCFFFVFDTSVVGVGGWAPGCADNVSGTVRHPLIIFTFFTV